MKELLSRELAKSILGNLGAVPNSVVGLQDPFLITGQTIEIVQEDGQVTKHDIFAGHAYELNGAMVNIGLDNEPEIVLVLDILEVGLFGLRFDWFNDSDAGVFLSHDGTLWVPMTMAQKLKLTYSFEVLVQEGLLWLPAHEPTKAKELLKKLLVDKSGDE